jgi:hypothetical protein
MTHQHTNQFPHRAKRSQSIHLWSVMVNASLYAREKHSRIKLGIWFRIEGFTLDFLNRKPRCVQPLLSWCHKESNHRKKLAPHKLVSSFRKFFYGLKVSKSDSIIISHDVVNTENNEVQCRLMGNMLINYLDLDCGCVQPKFLRFLKNVVENWS